MKKGRGKKAPSERTRRHCVMLENCCYGDNELTVLGMVRAGLLGELTHAEAAYIHDLREVLFDDHEGLWRRDEHFSRNGNLYPTHGLGPVAHELGLTCLLLSGFWVTNFALFFSRLGYTPSSIAAYYRGSEAEFRPPRTAGASERRQDPGDELRRRLVHPRDRFPRLADHDGNPEREESHRLRSPGRRRSLADAPRPFRRAAWVGLAARADWSRRLEAVKGGIRGLTRMKPYGALTLSILGLVIALAVLLLKFLRMLWEFILHAPGARSSETILDALSLIDVTLVGNLILIVVFSGYENFVSKIDPRGHPDWPDWMTKVDFGGLKQKLLASIVAVVLFARRVGADPWSVMDLAAAAAPMGLFFGRLANFINSELWGRPADASVPWAMVFPNGGPLPRHPSQLYAAAIEGIVLFTILAVMIRLGALKRPGLILGSFIAIYGIARIIGEFFREPDPQLGFLWGGLTMGMLLSVPMIVIGAIIIATTWRRKRTTQVPSPDQGTP